MHTALSISARIRAILLCLALLSLRTSAQPAPEYRALAKVARQYFVAGNLDSAAACYTRAFQIPGGAMRNDRYNAAQAYAATGQADSAFEQLRLLTRADWGEYDSLIADKYLFNLHKDARWKVICDKIRVIAGLDESKINQYASRILDTVLKDDQEGRNKLAETEKTYGRDSKEYKALVADITRKDSINVLKVTAIIDSFGWLGKGEVRPPGDIAEFLVMQHASPTVQKKYLPILRQAVKDGKLNPSYFALMEDRVLISEGKDQIYGSQVAEAKDGTYFVEPLQDPDNVDARRKSVGLGPISTYLQTWNISWDADAYKKNLTRYRQLEQELSADK